ncbi:MAG: LacI family transcriptional regulator [bacterium]|nr:LacI family transcriptional regulator [bacterium]
MVTQKEIADKLNISRTTVARALKDNASIKPEVKDKILKLAKKLGYSKNIIGSSLASRSNKDIYAFIVRSINENYSSEIIKGLNDIADEFRSYNFSINIIETEISEPEDQINRLKDILKNNNPAGIIIIPLIKSQIKEIIEDNKSVKFITLDIPIDSSIFHVGGDYVKSGKMSANIVSSMLRRDEEILVLDTEDDKISSKYYIEGFYNTIKDKKLTVIGPVYVENILKEIDFIIDNYLRGNVKALYSSRYLPEIVKILIKRIPNNRLLIVGNGMSSTIGRLIENETMIATVKEKHYEQGYFAGKFMFAFLYETKLDGINEYIINSEIIFKENLK